MFHVKQFDVLVVGGGHAGSEAAAASSRMGASTALVTIKTSDLGPKYHGKEIGNKLNELEFKWIKSKFKLSKAQLLRMI